MKRKEEENNFIHLKREKKMKSSMRRYNPATVAPEVADTRQSVLSPATVRGKATKDVLDMLPPEDEWTDDLLMNLRKDDLQYILRERGIRFKTSDNKDKLVSLVMDSTPIRPPSPTLVRWGEDKIHPIPRTPGKM